MDLERLRGQRDWSRKMKTGDFAAKRTQEAAFPRKLLALWIGKDGFSYMKSSTKGGWGFQTLYNTLYKYFFFMYPKRKVDFPGNFTFPKRPNLELPSYHAEIWTSCPHLHVSWAHKHSAILLIYGVLCCIFRIKWIGLNRENEIKLHHQSNLYNFSSCFPCDFLSVEFSLKPRVITEHQGTSYRL